METNYNNGNKTLLILFLIVVLPILLCSCGARKVDKSKTTTTEVATIVDSSKTTTKVDSNIKIVDTSESDEVTISPADTSKVMIVNGKTYKNVVLKRSKVKNNITTDKTIIASQIKQNNVKTAIVKNKVVEQKVTERESVVKWWWWLILLLLISAGYLTYRFYRKQSPF